MSKAAKKTVGAQANELLKSGDNKQGVIDTQREMHKKFISEIEKTIEGHKSWDFPFYIVVINKKERLIKNSIRNYFFARRSLPTPDYDQTVFKYDPSTGDLRFLWVLPDHETVQYMVLFPNDIPKEERQLSYFCHLFVNGKLEKEFGI